MGQAILYSVSTIMCFVRFALELCSFRYTLYGNYMSVEEAIGLTHSSSIMIIECHSGPLVFFTPEAEVSVEILSIMCTHFVYRDGLRGFPTSVFYALVFKRRTFIKTT